MQANILSIAVGVRYANAFRVLDESGLIIDNILYKNDHFDTKYFPRMQRTSYEASLHDEQEKCYFKLYPSSFIYCHHFGSIEDVSDAADLMKEKVSKGLVPHIIDKHELVISRLGIVYTVEVDEKALKKFKAKFFKEGFDPASFRFSQPNLSSEGLKDKQKQDFVNKIFTMISGENPRRISYDYQQIFEPYRPSWIDCKPANFFDASKACVENDLLKELE